MGNFNYKLLEARMGVLFEFLENVCAISSDERVATIAKKILDTAKTNGIAPLPLLEIEPWGGWATQYPNQLPKIWGAKEIAELNFYGDNGQRMFCVAEITNSPLEPIEYLDTDDELIKERDYLEEVLDKILDLALGNDREEWSTSYDYNNAINDVEERIAELTTGEWQPIEDAPLHKYVILCDKTKKVQQGYFLKVTNAGLTPTTEVGELVGHFCIADSWGETICKPIAWTPLPDAPSTPKETK